MVGVGVEFPFGNLDVLLRNGLVLSTKLAERLH